MVVRRLVGAVVALLSACTLVAAPAQGQTSAGRCEVGRPLVDVTYRFVNEQDLTTTGEVWALATGTSHFRLYQTGAGTFCAAITLRGTFTAFGGPSPAGTGTVPAGHRGQFVGVDSLYLVGTFAPQLPTRGFVGTFDGQCDQFECQNPIQFGRKYVEVAGPPMHGAYRFTYVSRCGVWTVTSDSERGDIAC